MTEAMRILAEVFHSRYAELKRWLNMGTIYSEVEGIEKRLDKVLVLLEVVEQKLDRALVLLDILQTGQTALQEGQAAQSARFVHLEQSQSNQTKQLEQIITMLTPPFPVKFRIDLSTGDTRP